MGPFADSMHPNQYRSQCPTYLTDAPVKCHPKKAGPVQNADAKFKELKAKIGATDSKVAKAIQGVSDWAVANPGKASIAVGILTAAAAMAGGPLGGAIGGFLARATKDLLQGADLSTAVGKSIKTGIVGALVGFGLEKIGDVIGDALAWGNDTINPSYMTAKWDYMDTDIGILVTNNNLLHIFFLCKCWFDYL